MPRYTIAIVAGPEAARETELDQALEVGRDTPEGLTLAEDDLVSRRHARLEPHRDGVLVTDLGSRNGTFVGGRRLDEPRVLAPGEQIVIGQTTLEVRENRLAATVAAPIPAAPAQRTSWALELVRGEGPRREIPLAGQLEIGRDPETDIVIEDEQVSRRHARLTVGEDGVLVEDLDSRNGTLVNGRRIRQPTLLEPGDRILVGEAALELQHLADGATQLSPIVTSDRVSAAHPVWTLVVAATALFMAVLDSLVVTFALPEIQLDLNASLAQLEWTVNSFTLAFAALLFTGATLGDRFGRKRMFVIGVAIFSVASAICALAPNMEILLAGRALQGLGAAVIMPLTLTLVSTAFPAEKRGLALGAWSGTAGLALALGPVVGGLIVSGLSWQWIFWLNVPIGLVLLPIAARFLTESFGGASRLDIAGVLLVTAGLFAVVFGVIRGGSHGWSSPEVIASIALGLALLVAFVFWERVTSYPIVALHLFRSRGFTTANIVALLMYFGVFGTVFLLAQFLQVAQGYSALEAGVRSLPWTGVPIFVAPLAGALMEKTGGRPLIALGMLFQCIGLGWMALTLSPTTSFWELLVPLVLAGAGMGLFFPPISYTVLGSVRPEEEGQASGINNALRQVGAAFGVAVMGSIFASRGANTSPQAFVDGLVPATALGAIVCGVAFLVALAIPRVREHEEGEEDLNQSVPAFGGLTPVTSQHAILSASHAVPQWELHSIPLAQADDADLVGWEPFAVAQDRLYLRRPAGRGVASELRGEVASR
jgi:EmrB/QacA subfamily drug resistance transporter